MSGLAYRSSSGRLYKNSNLLYIVNVFVTQKGAICYRTIQFLFIFLFLYSRSVDDRYERPKLIARSPNIDTRYVLDLFNNLLRILFCSFSRTLKCCSVNVNCTVRSLHGKVQIAKFEAVVSLFGGFEEPLSSETSRKTGIPKVDIVCYEYFQIRTGTRGQEGGRALS
jgi:hypothetical protein